MAWHDPHGGPAPAGRLPGRLPRRLKGWLCIAVAAAWLLAIGLILDGRQNRELIEIDGTLAQADTSRSQRPSGIALFTLPSLVVTLEAPRFLEGPYRPAFHFTPAPWEASAVERAEARLGPGMRVRMTVERDALEAAKTDLEERHQKELGSGIYSPGIFGSPGTVPIVTLELADDGAGGISLSESVFAPALVTLLCLLAAAVFAAAGANLLRRGSPQPGAA